MDHLDKKILDRIEREHIRVRPRWFFYAKDVFALSMALSLMVLASVFLGISLAFMVHGIDEISVSNFPYTIVVLFAGTIFLAYQAFIHSFSFYRLRISFSVALLLGIALSFGYLTFVNGQAERLERKLQGFPLYRAMVPKPLLEQERFEADEMNIDH